MERNGEFALILAHGERPSYELLQRLTSECRLFLATDGAANELAAIGIHPNIVFGDFDSLAPNLQERLPNVEFVSAPDQEASDLEKAIDHISAMGFRQITVVGASGGRLDHTLANAALLMKYCPFLDIRFLDDRSDMRAVCGEQEIAGAPGDTLSLIAFAPVEAVELTDVRWPLCAESLGPGTRGVSNVMTSDLAHLHVSGGAVILIHQRGEDVASVNA